MLNWLVKKQLDKFERRWGYDTSYVREIVDEAGVGAVMPLQGLEKAGSFRRNVPLETYYGAKITAAKLSDCGPCLQLVVSMAEDAGLAADAIRAILHRDEQLSSDARLGVDLALATIARDGSGDDARDQILRRWGRAGLVSLAYAIVAAQAYPTFKYAIGHGHACVRVRVGNETLPVKNAQYA